MRTRSLRRPAEAGQTLVLFILALTVMLGLTALVIDVGFFFNERRSLQNAADAAALAAVMELPASRAEAEAAAQEWASRNGYGPGKGASLTFISPYKGDSSKVEVTIRKRMSVFFARLLTQKPFNVSVRAVATRDAGGGVNAAFLVLNETRCKTFDKTGNANLIINGPGGIMANSACHPSLSRTGAGSVSAAVINYYEPGGYRETGSGAFNPKPVSVPERIPDPLAGTPPPNLAQLGISPDSGGTAPNPSTKTLSSGVHTLRPGVYYGGIDIKSTANVTFLPGIYALAGSGLKLTGSGQIRGNGVMFYNTFDPQKSSGAGACGSIDLGGGTQFYFTGPESGTYKDIVFWQDKACTNDFKLVGGSGGVGGVIYVPGGRVNLSGGGNLGSVQVIADTVSISGTGDLIVDFVPYLSIPLSGAPRLIE